MMQSFMTGGQNTAEISMATSTPTAERELEQSLESFQQPLHSKSSNNNDREDWSIPVSKFLQGFRVQAAASLSNAYRYVS